MAYDPDTDLWRLLPTIESNVESDTELAWTGRDLIARNLGNGVIRLEDMRGEWMPMPATSNQAGINSNLTWTGDELLAVTVKALGGNDYVQHIVAWQPQIDSWQLLSEAPSTIEDGDA
jgi:hypothetical protein